MIDCISVFILQFMFQLSRVWGQRASAADSIISTVFANLVLQCTGLFGIYVGLRACVEQNYWAIACYMVSGVLGTIVSFKIPIISKNNDK